MSAEDEDFAPDDKDFEDDADELRALVAEEGISLDALIAKPGKGVVPGRRANVDDMFAAMKAEDAAFVSVKKRSRAVQSKADAKETAWLRRQCMATAKMPRMPGPVRGVISKAKRCVEVLSDVVPCVAAAAPSDAESGFVHKRAKRCDVPSAASIALAAKAKHTIAQTKAVYTEVVRYAGQSIKYVCPCC